MEPVKEIKVSLVKSPIGEVEKVKETVKGLGLRKLHQTVTIKNNKAMRGMLKKVSHLVKIEV